MSEAGEAPTAPTTSSGGGRRDPLGPRAQEPGGPWCAPGRGPGDRSPPRRKPLWPRGPCLFSPAGTEDAEKKLLATKILGMVKWFNVRNGYGFIHRHDTKEDVFIHRTAIQRDKPWGGARSVGCGHAGLEAVEGGEGAEAPAWPAQAGMGAGAPPRRSPAPAPVWLLRQTPGPSPGLPTLQR